MHLATSLDGEKAKYVLDLISKKTDDSVRNKMQNFQRRFASTRSC
jgi:hypothetical protein